MLSDQAGMTERIGGDSAVAVEIICAEASYFWQEMLTSSSLGV